MRDERRRERGLTLTEVTITIVLASVVMSGLVIFYLNSQATWIDGSSQAITQREATLVLHEISTRAHEAAYATALGNPNATLTLGMSMHNNPSAWLIAWDPTDSLLHETYVDSTGVPHATGQMLQSKVATFSVSWDANMVRVDTLTLLTPQGTRITVWTAAELVNRGAP